MNNSSERIDPSKWSNNRTQYLLFLRHVAVYNFITKKIEKNLVGLDFGCGDGYGTHFLSKYTSKIYGVDINKETVRAATKKYDESNLIFIDMVDGKLPYNEESIDFISSCQVIEHLDKPYDYFLEAKRVLRNKGYCFVATPNKLTRLNSNEKPWNKFHIKEYSPDELREYLQKLFSEVEIYGVFGNEEIMKIEKKRVNIRKTLQRFDILNIRFIIPTSVEYKIQSVINKLFSRKIKNKDVSNYSIDDFQVSKNNVDKSMDLVAVCKK